MEGFFSPMIPPVSQNTICCLAIESVNFRGFRNPPTVKQANAGGVVVLMEEILHRLGCIKPSK